MPFWHREQRPDSDPRLHVVVGLGNPGARYERTRHNVGYMTVNEMARRAGVTFSKSKHRADVARTTLDGVPVLLALPVTYMNDSGQAVSRLLSYYRVPIENLLVIADDLDLPFGTLRLRPSGSSGGQRGLQSIFAQLGTDGFPRLRLGVGRPRGDAAGHVLSPFDRAQEAVLPRLVGVAADAATAAIVEGVQPTMNRCNRDWLQDIEVDSPSRPG